MITTRLLAMGSLAFAASAILAQQQLVLPDNHHLTESATQVGIAGSATWWRTAGGRFQILYEASNFTGTSAVSGPIVITKLMFRAEDGEPNLGGQSWTGVTVELGATTLTNVNMSTTFATNRAPVAPQTTTMGTPVTANVTVLPALGTYPNNYVIVIDLLAAGAPFTFDPTSAEPNLLIDVTIPTAATVPPGIGNVVDIQDTSGTAAFVRGEGVTTTTPGAATGTTSASPPVVGLEFLGSGGFTNPTAAKNQFYGAACGGSPSTFYQSFLMGQPFTLTGLTLVPDNVAAPSFYVVQGGAQPFDASKVNATPNSVVDDAVLGAHALGYTFAFPGGSTAALRISTNGYVWLDGTTVTSDASPTVAEMLGSTGTGPARLMPFWYDWDPGGNPTIANAGLHVLNDTSGGPGNTVTYITWFRTGIFETVQAAGVGGHGVFDLQCVLHQATGIVEYRYGAMPAFCSNYLADIAGIVGFTRGRIGTTASVDPQPRDLTNEVPFTTSVEGARGHMGITAVATPDAGGAAYGGRMFAGQSVRWNVSNVPPGSVLGATLIDLAGTTPGLQLPGIIRPGCMFSLSANALALEVVVTPAATVVGAVPFPVPAGYDPTILGVNVHAQFFVLDGLFGGPDLITVASNSIRHTVGLD